MDDITDRTFRVTLDQFHAHRDSRPKEEKWELIDGAMTMMPPPSLTHQRISKSLLLLLTARLALIRPEWQADMEIGVLLPKDERYNPEPDVTVIDADFDPDRIYAERFYFVAEVHSPADKPRILDLKRAYYQAHEHCRGCIFVRQDRIEAEFVVRSTGGWTARTLTVPSDVVDIPDIGVIGSLGELYRYTHLALKR
jgi:Uma2 family endonuclease